MFRSVAHLRRFSKRKMLSRGDEIRCVSGVNVPIYDSNAAQATSREKMIIQPCPGCLERASNHPPEAIITNDDVIESENDEGGFVSFSAKKDGRFYYIYSLCKERGLIIISSAYSAAELFASLFAKRHGRSAVCTLTSHSDAIPETEYADGEVKREAWVVVSLPSDAFEGLGDSLLPHLQSIALKARGMAVLDITDDSVLICYASAVNHDAISKVVSAVADATASSPIKDRTSFVALDPAIQPMCHREWTKHFAKAGYGMAGLAAGKNLVVLVKKSDAAPDVLGVSVLSGALQKYIVLARGGVSDPTTIQVKAKDLIRFHRTAVKADSPARRVVLYDIFPQRRDAFGIGSIDATTTVAAHELENYAQLATTLVDDMKLQTKQKEEFCTVFAVGNEASTTTPIQFAVAASILTRHFGCVSTILLSDDGVMWAVSSRNMTRLVTWLVALQLASIDSELSRDEYAAPDRMLDMLCRFVNHQVMDQFKQKVITITTKSLIQYATESVEASKTQSSRIGLFVRSAVDLYDSLFPQHPLADATLLTVTINRPWEQIQLLQYLKIVADV